jgi:hypothetical protein
MVATEGSTELRLLQTVVENATWKCRVLQTRLFEPFEILRHSNHESSRNEKENSIFPLFSGSQTCAAAVFLDGRYAVSWTEGV